MQRDDNFLSVQRREGVANLCESLAGPVQGYGFLPRLGERRIIPVELVLLQVGVAAWGDDAVVYVAGAWS